MSNIIKILPDSLANQIAAGEVIQRPASIIKELVENAIDAKATKITINIKDAGRTLIQVIDNGTGMSQDDARLSFERHATSKLSTTEDLFAISTKGFRGEALASIAAVANVELKTKREEDPIGTKIVIEASKLIEIESVNTPSGSNFSVKNLFFNIPARRKFLKADGTEFKHILTELYRMVIPHFQVEFTVIHNNETVLKLLPEGLKERIISIFDKSLNKQLVSISTDAGFIKITGYVGKPEFATKSNAKQYFFVNNRFMKNGYFHKAVTISYEKLLNAEAKPSYFIFFDIDPGKIDVNIHPTKTEINFDEASNIFQILLSVVRKALTEFDIPPAIDFENTDFVNLGSFDKNQEVSMPEINLNPNYNPFDEAEKEFNFHSKISNSKTPTQETEMIFGNENDSTVENSPKDKYFINLKNKYIITPVKSGLMTINIKRAFEQIEYEKLLNKISDQSSTVQALYPVQINFSSLDLQEFEHVRDKLEDIGFRFEKINDRTYNITGIPTYIKLEESSETILKLLKMSELTNLNFNGLNKEEIAIQILKTRIRKSDTILKQDEMQELLNKLFTCQSHQYTYDGKTIISIIDIDQINDLFS
ncbi:MAG: DNA mismatch repair endonuclease MutL [Bacteroidales bacterium]|nr:DNA mismatch repair endonuclease MutL [Bacteroidales bacterium]